MGGSVAFLKNSGLSAYNSLNAYLTKQVLTGNHVNNHTNIYATNFQKTQINQ
jgi:hypothetical protein